MSNTIIKLVEHKGSSSEDILGSLSDEDYKDNKKKLEGLKLETKEDQKLKQILKDEGILTIKQLTSGLEISPSSYIGTVQFSNFTVRVYPKYSMDPKNVRQMLDYVWDVKPKIQIKFLESTIDVEKEETTLLVDIVITSLIDQCNLLLKQGLFRSYVVHEENVPFLRGKLLLKQQIQNTLKNNAKFACQFDELEYDNLENQILLAALGESHNITNDDELKRDLRLLIYQFSIFTSRPSISIQDFDNIQYDRLNQRYESPHNLSRLILEASGFREYSSGKKIKIKPFFINMDDVFEKFIEKLFRRYYSKSNRYNVQSQKTTKAWRSDSFRDYSIRTDILVSDTRDKNKKFILDTKYKSKLSPQDRYQIAFYIHEYRQMEGTALLPTFPDEKPDELTSEEHKIKIHVKRIDINDVIDKISNKSEKELLKIVDDIVCPDMRVPT